MEIGFDDYAQREDYIGREYFHNLLNDYEKNHKTLEDISENAVFKKVINFSHIILSQPSFFLDDLGFYDYEHMMRFMGMDFHEFERVLFKGKVERHGKIFNVKINSERIKRILKVKELLGNFF